MRINRVATCSSQRSTKHVRRGFGVGRSQLDGADAQETEQRGFDSRKPDGADAWETEQHDFGSSKPDGADRREAERRGFGSNEANGAGI